MAARALSALLFLIFGIPHVVMGTCSLSMALSPGLDIFGQGHGTSALVSLCVVVATVLFVWLAWWKR